MASSRARVLALAAVLLGLLAIAVAPVSALGVIAFDYGADSLKTALVKPGMAPDVVLTRDSKRKLPSAVGWKNQERSFGTDAINVATRYPGDTFPAAKLLLGRSADAKDQSVLDRYSALLNSTIVPTERNTLAVERATDYTLSKDGPDVHTVEELVAMQLSHARELAEEMADEKVRVTYPGTIGTFGGLDTVITVPTFWTAAERQAIFDAAALAGFKPRLVSDAAAAATSYALTRTFEKPELHLLYDSGHAYTRASLVRFSTRAVPTEDLFGTSMKDHTFIEVLSTGWSREAGGLALDETLRSILVSKFKSSHKSIDVEKNARAMAKLLASASKAKHVLSANSDARVYIEGLIEDVDFSTSVTRDEFEEAVTVKGLDAGFGSPVGDALRRGGHSLSDLRSVILIGGSSRVPLVQKTLNSAGISSDLIAQNLNADESIALGAGFWGASFNAQLKIKPFRVADVNPFPIVLREADGKEEVLWKGSPETFESDVKVRTYDGQTSDFTFEIEYGSEAETEGKLDTFSRSLYRVEVDDIDATLSSLKTAGDLSKVDTFVNVSIVSKPLGAVAVEQGRMTVKPKKTGLAGTLRSFFGGSAPEASSSSVNASAESASNATANATESSGSNSSSSVEAADLASVKNVRLITKTLPMGSVKAMTGEQQTKSKDKLYLMDSMARRKAQTEEIRNKLESYVYRMRELPSDKSFEGSSSEGERSKIASASKEMAEWLASGQVESERTTLEDLKKKLASLESLVKPIQARMEESRGRGGAEKRLLRALEDADEFLKEANANLTAAIAEGTSSRYSRTDLDSLQGDLKRERQWFEKAREKQASKGQHDEPAWKVEEAEKKTKRFVDKVTKMKRRKIPKTRPSKSSSSASSSSSSQPPAGKQTAETPVVAEGEESKQKSNQSGSASSPSQSQAQSSQQAPPVVHEEL